MIGIVVVPESQTMYAVMETPILVIAVSTYRITLMNRFVQVSTRHADNVRIPSIVKGIVLDVGTLIPAMIPVTTTTII